MIETENSVVDSAEVSESKDFQKLEAINFVEAQSGQEADLVVYESEVRSETEILQQELKELYWWFDEYWREKGLPKEQYKIKVGQEEIDLYNWGEILSQKQMSDIEDALKRLMSQCQYGLAGLKYILLDDKEPNHPEGLKDQKLRGMSLQPKNVIIIYPPGVKETAYRDGEMGDHFSELNGIMVHEIGHRYVKQYTKDGIWELNRWIEEFGKFDSIKKRFEVKDPTQCLTEYGRSNSIDDYCECLVALIYNPEKLKEIAPEKFQFIRENYFKNGNPKSEVSIEKMKDIVMPELPETQTYEIKKLEKSKFETVEG